MTVISAHLTRTGTLTAPDAPVLPWWSFTKTLIAALTCKAAARGVIDLDAPCKPYRWTLRHLLGHRTGLGDYGARFDYQAAVTVGGPPWTRAEFLDAVPLTPRTAPGTTFAYSNVGYLLVVNALEQATGKTLDSLVQEFASPLGLHSVRLAQTAADFDGLPFPSGGYHPGWVAHRCALGTPADAMRLLRHILDDPDLAQMQQALPLSFDDPARIWTKAGYGLGLMIGTAGDTGRALGHSGGGAFSANAVYAFPDQPDAPIVATFMAGGDEGPAEHAAARLARHGPTVAS